jgi:hypothetical protein
MLCWGREGKRAVLFFKKEQKESASFLKKRSKKLLGIWFTRG